VKFSSRINRFFNVMLAGLTGLAAVILGSGAAMLPMAKAPRAVLPMEFNLCVKRDAIDTFEVKPGYRDIRIAGVPPDKKWRDIDHEPPDIRMRSFSEMAAILNAAT